MSDTKTGVSTAPVTYQNKVRHFSYTIPAGWRLERGDPTGNAERDNIIFMKPGTTCGFTIHWTQMVPSFPRKAAVDASYKQAKEEKGIGKYMAVKRRDQGGKSGVIGWETIETAEKGSGGFQRIQWQCYDGQNYLYSFMAHANPRILTPTGRKCRESSIPSDSTKAAPGRSPRETAPTFPGRDLAGRDDLTLIIPGDGPEPLHHDPQRH